MSRSPMYWVQVLLGIAVLILVIVVILILVGAIDRP
jgi:hypothetical protein